MLTDERLRDEDLPRAAAIRERLARPVTSMRRRAGLMSGVLEEIDAAAREAGVAVFGIKGLSARRFHARPEVRDFSDWDLYAADEPSAWALVAALRRRGYDCDPFELPWIKRDLDDGSLYGQVMLGRVIDGEEVLVDAVRRGLVRHRRPARRPGGRRAGRPLAGRVGCRYPTGPASWPTSPAGSPSGRRGWSARGTTPPGPCRRRCCPCRPQPPGPTWSPGSPRAAYSSVPGTAAVRAAGGARRAGGSGAT